MMLEQNIVFGAGPLGWWVAQVLAQKGRSVTLVSRSGKIDGLLGNEISIAAANATDAEAVFSLCRQAAAVFHCAMPPYTRWPEEFPALTKGILEGVARAGAKLIYGDNLYAYGAAGGRPLREELPAAATDRKGRVRAEMAAMLLEAHREGRVSVAIGRASDFFGPRVINATLGEMFFSAALSDRPVNLIGDIEKPHTYTYIRDFARALVTLSENQTALGQVWHVPSAPTLTTRQMVRLVESQIGRPVKVRSAGKWMLTLLGLINPMVREVREVLYQWEQPYVMEHARFERAFGADPTPHETAIRETLAWYRRRGH